MQYKVFLGDCVDIADIPHGYNIRNITYDCEPYTYQSFNKVVLGFIDVTTSPLWRFVVFQLMLLVVSNS